MSRSAQLATLNESPRMKHIMDNAKIMSSQRQPPNLKSILTPSNFSSQEKEKGISKCGDPLCGNCPYMMEGRSIEMENGDLFEIQGKLNCKVNKANTYKSRARHK